MDIVTHASKHQRKLSPSYQHLATICYAAFIRLITQPEHYLVADLVAKPSTQIPTSSPCEGYSPIGLFHTQPLGSLHFFPHFLEADFQFFVLGDIAIGHYSSQVGLRKSAGRKPCSYWKAMQVINKSH